MNREEIEKSYQWWCEVIHGEEIVGYEETWDDFQCWIDDQIEKLQTELH